VNAIELYKKDGSATGVFYCSECRAVFPNQEQAQLCHGERLCPCGSKTESRYATKCGACSGREFRERETAKESKRFEDATKIAEADYAGEMVYCGDKFYDSVEEALDDYLPGQEPEYVWACQDEGVPKASADSLYENLLENMWEDADASDLNGVPELEAAIDAFNKANESISVWQPDYSKAILVGARKDSK
jgi:hypothetical protein